MSLLENGNRKLLIIRSATPSRSTEYANIFLCNNEFLYYHEGKYERDRVGLDDMDNDNEKYYIIFRPFHIKESKYRLSDVKISISYFNALFNDSVYKMPRDEFEDKYKFVGYEFDDGEYRLIEEDNRPNSFDSMISIMYTSKHTERYNDIWNKSEYSKLKNSELDNTILSDWSLSLLQILITYVFMTSYNNSYVEGVPATLKYTIFLTSSIFVILTSLPINLFKSDRLESDRITIPVVPILISIVLLALIVFL